MIHWESREGTRLPIKSWCREVEPKALAQALSLANHPALFHHVALMPDCHVGFGMPIGGVVAARDAVIPNAVGVDIGCGMRAARTTVASDRVLDKALLRAVVERVKEAVPVGEGRARRLPLGWSGFEEYRDALAASGGEPGWLEARGWELDALNLGTLGGGNHFIELDRGDDGRAWLMLHSGSRNLGYRIANYYHRAALDLDLRRRLELPDRELAYLPLDEELGRAYLRDMDFALRYAAESRRLMMEALKEAFASLVPGAGFDLELDIHHNYAARETHLGREAWVHRKGATKAGKGERGIIPGSMGSPSYIVEGLGNEESFQSCSHGAGRRMGRAEACRRLDPAACEEAMRGIVHDRFGPARLRGAKGGRGLLDLSEAPQAYKDIEEVLASELDLVRPLVRLEALAVVKG